MTFIYGYCPHFSEWFVLAIFRVFGSSRLPRHVSDDETCSFIENVTYASQAKDRSSRIKDNHLVLFEILQSVSKTLTKLSIIVHSSVTLLPRLFIILATCPNITVLHLRLEDVRHHWYSRLSALTTITSLTELRLECPKNTEMPLPEIEYLIRSSPSLKYIDLNSCSCDILSTTKRYCPDLTGLSLNSGNGIEYHSPWYDTRPRGSLRSLFVRGMFSPTSVLSFLEAAQDSLEELTLVSEFIGTVTQDWSVFSNLEMKNLTELHIQSGTSGLHTIVPSIVRSCPRLTNIVLSHFNVD